MSEWSAEQVALAVSLWKQNEVSAGVIGERVEKTRNAVIGKMHRLGVERAARSGAEPPQSVVELPPPVVVPPPEPEGVLFLTATRCCKFPLWGHHDRVPIHEKRVCGARVTGKDKWCEKHKAVVFEPMRERRSRGVI